MRYALVGLALATAGMVTVPATAATASTSPRSSSDSGTGGYGHTLTLVTAAAGKGPAVWAAASDLGGHLDTLLVPDVALWRLSDSEAAALRKKSGVASVVAWDPGAPPIVDRTFAHPFVPTTDVGSVLNAADTIGATTYWKRAYTGQGVDVAVIDSGVAPLPELQPKLVNGPDLSFDSSVATGGSPANDGIDAYGHGTHIAGIIAGLTPGGPALPKPGNKSAVASTFTKWAADNFVGVAPGSRIINVRAGASDGAVDVSQIIAGIDWVVAHKDDSTIGGGLHIRVLNLSYGTDGPLLDGADTATARLHDAMEAAVEWAWSNGIVVVVSGGNDGFGRSLLDDPALDPYVIAVGAADSNNTVKPNDDTIADFSSRGSLDRRVDVVAPGRSITSLAVPNSVIDETYPGGRVGLKYFKGSGTSQAAGVVSGAAAVLLSAEPTDSPALVKSILMGAGQTLRNTGKTAPVLDRGLQQLDLTQVSSAESMIKHGKATLQDVSKSPLATATDLSLEVARGSYHVSFIDADGNLQELRGEVDVTGADWDGRIWRSGEWDGRIWRSETWNGATWTAGTWDGRIWRSRGWSGGSWQGSVWSGRIWRNNSWQATP
jgi:serine protease AprX